VEFSKDGQVSFAKKWKDPKREEEKMEIKLNHFFKISVRKPFKTLSNER
jgi:hypothetical protein